MSGKGYVLGAVALATLLFGLPAVARANDSGPDNDGPNWHANWHATANWDEHQVVHAVPGPIAGVGLPVLVVAGGYLAWRKRRGSKTSTGASQDRR